MTLVLQPGSSFGRYRVHKRIARGGMADVWYGTAYGLGGFRKRVVIKTIRPELAENPEYIKLLVNEASLAAQLSHPNIVQVFDLGCTNGIYFIAMEYLPGRTLAQVLQRVRKNQDEVPAWLALSALASCCDGLQYAHDLTDSRGNPLGLLHQDLSPSNVMLSFNGNVSILDFGVARATLVASEERKVLRGKYHYMAPERVRGQQPDRRSDVYSLGVILYQLLTQVRPFEGDATRELLRRIATGRPPLPSTIVPGMPEDIEQVILKAMAPQVEDRHADAYSMGMDLRACLRRLGEVHEARDRARYLGWLFPESRESTVQREPAADTSISTSALAELDASSSDEDPSIQSDPVGSDPMGSDPMGSDPAQNDGQNDGQNDSRDDEPVRLQAMAGR